MTTLNEILEHDAAIPTWFHCGGRADLLARPRSVGELRDLLLAFASEPIRILGDGANLLVADEGVDGLVISLEKLDRAEFDTPTRHSALVRAEAGAKLPQLITEAVRRGLAGLETLAGIPATIGGAVVMNAGGAFGQVSDVVAEVEALTRAGAEVRIPRAEIHFGYRHSGLNHLIITAATFALRPVPAAGQPALREKLKEVMAYKKGSQPMAAHSAGCCFKNPAAAPGSDTRVSAGRLIDEAGCKGLRIGGAEVSAHHANFIVAHPGCTATDVIRVMEEVERHVRDRLGVRLEREVVVWRRGESP